MVRIQKGNNHVVVLSNTALVLINIVVVLSNNDGVLTLLRILLPFTFLL